MKRKISVGLVFALVLVSLSVIALATGLILSPRVSAARTADLALAEKYGITDELQSFFGREEEELPDGTVKVTYFGAGSLEATLGTYTVLVKDGKADISWSLEGKNTAGGYEAEAWGLEQLKQMAEDSHDEKLKAAFMDKSFEIYKQLHPDDEEVPVEAPDPETFEEYHARREGEKSSALDATKLSEEDMIAIGREFILSTYSLTDSEVERLELYTNSYETEDANHWYETVNGKPCFLVEYLLDEEGVTEEMLNDPNYYRMNSYFKVFVNVETGVIEQYEFSNGLGGIG